MRNTISNISCLIVSDNIEMLDILNKLYEKVIITEEVSKEFGKPIPEWIEIRKVNDNKYLKLLKNFVDLGEASTIAFCVELDDSS